MTLLLSGHTIVKFKITVNASLNDVKLLEIPLSQDSHFIIKLSITFVILFLKSLSSCADCHSSCSSCNGSSESQCILCKSNRFSFEGKCLNSCPDGFYGDKKRKECLPCATGCATCSSEKCLTCKPDWVKNKKDKCVTNGSNNCDECKYDLTKIIHSQFPLVSLKCPIQP